MWLILHPSSTLPVLVTPGEAQGVYVVGDYAYVADGDAGLTVFDVSTLSSPSEAGSFDTDGYAQNVYVSPVTMPMWPMAIKACASLISARQLLL